MAQRNKVIKYHKNSRFDIGVVIFLIIIIYVLYSFFAYITSSPIAVYEVTQGTIATNNVYRGLIIRDETIEYANQTGYINYYIPSGSKVSVRDTIYSVDTTGEISKKISSAVSNGSVIDNSMVEYMIEEISGYTKNYNEVNFSPVYIFKQNLASELNQKLSSKALNKLGDEVVSAEANNTFFTMQSETSGVISYMIDGYENVTEDNFQEKTFDNSNLSENNLETNKEVKVLDPVYKRVNSEEWNIIIQINDTLADSLKETKYLKLRFCKDDYTANAACTIIKRDGNYYLGLKLNKAMIRYINERFIDIELVINTNSGLKIPNSAITSKTFFTVPKKYFSAGGDSDKLGLLIKSKDSKENTVNLVSPTIYYEDENYYYIDSESVSSGDVIVLNDSKKTYTIGNDTADLQGVYNVNKGFAVFKQISPIASNDEYTIVETKTSYGLSLYDHIALDGAKVKENQTIVK